MRNFIEKHIGGTLLSCRLDCAIKMELRVVAIKVSRCQHAKDFSCRAIVGGS